MRHQLFTPKDINDNFKDMITNGSAFDFDMNDIARIREEFATLIDRLSPKYLAIKDAEEKAAKRAKKNAPSNSEFYEEETAWRFHNPDFALDENDNLTVSRDASIPSLTPPTSHKLLKCIPPPPPLPTLPSTGFCAWSFDSDSRVLLANFRDPILAETTKGKVTIVHEDEVFLFKMMVSFIDPAVILWCL
jgi:hypothetical protein